MIKNVYFLSVYKNKSKDLNKTLHCNALRDKKCTSKLVLERAIINFNIQCGIHAVHVKCENMILSITVTSVTFLGSPVLILHQYYQPRQRNKNVSTLV